MYAGKNLMGNRKLNRKNYEAVKKMDRQQFERFCESLYNQGIENAGEGSLSEDEIREAVLSVKGIGEKRADLIVEEIMKRLSKR